MISDYHLHSFFSGDSEASPHAMVERAISLGMKTICFTDHCDTDSEDPAFILDTDAYMNRMMEIREQYWNRIEVCIGVELGMQPHLAKRHLDYVKQYPFDFIIASQHLVYGKDPYYPEVFQEREDRAVYRRYFEELYENVKVFSEYHVLGHLDYVVRYGTHKAEQYGYNEYADIIDAILRNIVQNGCGIEVNTSGLKYGLSFPNPHMDILRRYRELGGEIITIGSDAHSPEYIGYDFSLTVDILKDIGFGFLAEFRQKAIRFVQI